MAAVGVALGLGALSVAPQIRGPTFESDVDIDENFRANHRDLDESGISMGAARTGYLNLTNLNEAWKPRTAPRQVSTNNISDVYRSQADSDAYLFEYAPAFYFQTYGDMPLSTAEQSNPSVEVPSNRSSIRYDPNNSLLYYPRVYVDVYDGMNPHYFTGDYGTMSSAGMPTESEVRFLPQEGYLNYNMSPFGPGGDLQSLYNYQSAQLSRIHGVDRSVILRQPSSNYFSSRYFKRN